ncbi:MAG: xanthine dehydrogenase family protein subunit M [Bacteroidota bacterium]
MIPSNFEYKRVSSVNEALLHLSAGGDTKLLAGGHSLIPAMKLRLNSPATLIDIGRIPELKQIDISGETLSLGGGVTHGDIEHHAQIREVMPMLSEAAGLIGDPAVRNNGTLGGSLVHADPAADWPGVMIAANATIVVRSSGGQREIAADDFFKGFYTTDLQEGEILTEVRIPLNPTGTGKLVSVYEKFMQPASRFAIVGCAVVMRIDRGPTCTYARIGFSGVSDMAFRDTTLEGALMNQILSGDKIEEAVAQAAEGKDILSDPFASERYRKHLAKVYAKRALNRAVSM